MPRSVDHTVAIAEYFELKTLWEEYGIVGDVIVSCSYQVGLGID